MKKRNDPRLRGLYAILDTASLHTRDLIDSAHQAILGGAKILQYRDKTLDSGKRLQAAVKLKSLCEQHDILLIINDDIALASESKAHGVHLGRDDASIAQARQSLGNNSIIGISCYNEIQRAITAEAQSADYIAFGAFYSSPTKPNALKADMELLRLAKRELLLPICAIGGITADNANPLIQAGADMVAVISGIFKQYNIQLSAHAISTLFETNS